MPAPARAPGRLEQQAPLQCWDLSPGPPLFERRVEPGPSRCGTDASTTSEGSRSHPGGTTPPPSATWRTLCPRSPRGSQLAASAGTRHGVKYFQKYLNANAYSFFLRDSNANTCTCIFVQMQIQSPILLKKNFKYFQMLLITFLNTGA